LAGSGCGRFCALGVGTDAVCAELRRLLVLAQGVQVTAGTVYDLSMKLRSSDANTGVGAIDAFFYSSTNCSGPSSSLIEVYATRSPVAFQTIAKRGTAPGGSQSALVELGGSRSSTGGANVMEYDDVYFGPEAVPSCVADANTLCLDNGPGDHRFQVRMHYATTEGGGRAGDGNAISTASLGVVRGGLFWFFSSDNPEVLIKVLDGCSSSGFFWVFISAGTNVGVDVTVADTLSGTVALFHNPDISAFPSVQNTSALSCELVL
jgi:hypothetical protein